MWPLPRVGVECGEKQEDFPGGPADKNLPAGDAGCPCISTTEPVLCNRRSHLNEKPVHFNEEWPLLVTTRESLCAAMRPSAAKNKYLKKKKKTLKKKGQNLSWFLVAFSEPSGFMLFHPTQRRISS